MPLYLQTYVNLNGQNMQYFSIGNFPTTCHIWWKITKVKGKKNKGKYFFTKTNLAVNLFHLKVYSAHLYSVNTTKLASNTKSLEIFFPESIVEGGPYFWTFTEKDLWRETDSFSPNLHHPWLRNTDDSFECLSLTSSFMLHDFDDDSISSYTLTLTFW